MKAGFRGCLSRDRRSSEVVASPRGSFHHEADIVSQLVRLGAGQWQRAGNTCCSVKSRQVCRVHREGDRLCSGGADGDGGSEMRRDARGIRSAYLAVVVVFRRR